MAINISCINGSCGLCSLFFHCKNGINYVMKCIRIVKSMFLMKVFFWFCACAGLYLMQHTHRHAHTHFSVSPCPEPILCPLCRTLNKHVQSVIPGVPPSPTLPPTTIARPSAHLLAHNPLHPLHPLSMIPLRSTHISPSPSFTSQLPAVLTHTQTSGWDTSSGGRRALLLKLHKRRNANVISIIVNIINNPSCKIVLQEKPEALATK